MQPGRSWPGAPAQHLDPASFVHGRQDGGGLDGDAGLIGAHQQAGGGERFAGSHQFAAQCGRVAIGRDGAHTAQRCERAAHLFCRWARGQPPERSRVADASSSGAAKTTPSRGARAISGGVWDVSVPNWSRVNRQCQTPGAGAAGPAASLAEPGL